jgi:hypothetical protein
MAFRVRFRMVNDEEGDDDNGAFSLSKPNLKLGNYSAQVVIGDISYSRLQYWYCFLQQASDPIWPSLRLADITNVVYADSLFDNSFDSLKDLKKLLLQKSSVHIASVPGEDVLETSNIIQICSMDIASSLVRLFVSISLLTSSCYCS